MLQTLKALRIFFVVSLISIVILPLYLFLYLQPSVTSLILKNIEQESVRITRHLALLLKTDDSDLSKVAMSDDFAHHIKEFREGLPLFKIKLFSSDGEVLYSTDSKDMGTVNDKPYFHDIVASGSPYSKVVKRNAKSEDSHIFPGDVVETYVPVMEKGQFKGAFEIYYDATARAGDVDTLLSNIYIAVFFVTALLLGALLVSSFKAKKAFNEKMKADDDIRYAQDMLIEYASQLEAKRNELKSKVLERTAALQAANEELETEVGERIRNENVLREIADNISNKTGEAYYRSLLEFISEKLNTEYVLIGELTGGGGSIQTVAVLARGSFTDNFVYRLEGTPCEKVIGKEMCVHTSRIQELFPEDKLLKKMDVESYAGIPLFDSGGAPLGLIAVLGCNHMNDDDVQNMMSLLQILSMRAAAELERSRMEEVIINSKEEWENTFNTINDMITIHDNDFNIVRANRAAERFLGLSLSEIAEKKCYETYHGSSVPPKECLNCKSMEKGESCTVEFFEPNLAKYLEVKSLPRYDDSGRKVGLIHVARNITSRKADEEKIQKQMEYLKALRTIDNAIVSSLDMCHTLDTFASEVLNQLKVDAAAVLLLNPHTKLFNYAAGKGFKTKKINSMCLRFDSSFAGQVARKRESIFITNLNTVDSIVPPESDYAFSKSFFVKEEGFKSYFAVPLIAKGQVKGILEVFRRTEFHPDGDWTEFLEALAGQASIAIDNALMYEDLQLSRDELVIAYDSTIEGWSRALDYRDKETEGHSQRVTDLTVKIARAMGIKDRDVVHIRRGALLHDIGKLGVPDKILLKPGKLSAEEWTVMSQHPEIAFKILSPIEFLQPALDIPYGHHEKWDGTGYPRGLKGEQIPLPARIFAIVDVWDALRSDRPYRKAWPEEKVREHILAGSGTHFDPDVVDAFVKMKFQGLRTTSVY